MLCSAVSVPCIFLAQLPVVRDCPPLFPHACCNCGHILRASCNVISTHSNASSLLYMDIYISHDLLCTYAHTCTHMHAMQSSGRSSDTSIAMGLDHTIRENERLTTASSAIDSMLAHGSNVLSDLRNQAYTLKVNFMVCVPPLLCPLASEMKVKVY